MIKHLIFDLDWTLVKAWTTEYLGGVEDWLKKIGELPGEERPHISIATNQGSIGLRHWMEKEKFGNPNKYRPRSTVEKDIVKVILDIRERTHCFPSLRVCYAYQSKAGEWAPTPEGEEGDKTWRHDFRKPAPGMLTDLMAETGIRADETVFIGDQETDRQAAEAAGCRFSWAWDFFGREKPNVPKSTNE